MTYEIYRPTYCGRTYDCEINVFCGRETVEPKEIVIKTDRIMGKNYTWAEPVKPGRYAFGGGIICPDGLQHPVKLHDRNMDLES